MNLDDEDHLFGALLHGESSGGSGRYNNLDVWSVSLNGQESVGARLVTVHEALHVVLNDTTATGIRLAACAVLARVEGDQYAQTLKRLVGECRGVHEAFATFESLWLVALGDRSYLQAYPRYLGWYKDAAELIPLPDHLRRKEMLLDAAVRACMQVPVLEPFRVADPGAWWDTPAALRPDQRFGLLHRHMTPDLWNGAWARTRSELGENPLWDVLSASDDDVSLRPDTYDPVLDDALAACAHLLYVEVAAVLRSHGAPTLTYDGHRDLTAEVIAAVERLWPATAGELIPSEDARSRQDEAFEMWRRERLVVRESPRPAVMAQFADVLTERKVNTLLSPGSGGQHIFVAVRPAFRIRQQFQLAAGDDAWLAGQGAAPVAVARSSAIGSTAPVDLTVISEPSQLAGLAGALPGQVRVHANVSLACLGETGWRDQWSGALRRTQLSGLVDLSPMAQLDLWRNEGQHLRYAQASIGDGIEMMAWQPDDSGFPLLVICSAVVSDVLAQYLEQTYAAATPDPQLILERRDQVEVVISHLVRLGGADGDTVAVTSSDLEEMWFRLLPDTYTTRRGLEGFLYSVQQTAGTRDDADLHLRPGGWQVDLSRGVVQSVVATGLLAGLLLCIGATGIPAAALGVLVPMFFDVEKIRLARSDEYLLADLAVHADALDGSLTSDELYQRLAPELRADLPYREFLDFLDLCRRAGLADEGEFGTVTLRPRELAQFRVTFV